MDEKAMNLGSRTKVRGNSHLNHGPRTLKLGNWSGVRGFDAYTERQFVTESTNINSLADHHIWSTIKILSATLPELSFKGKASSAGVTEAVSLSDLGLDAFKELKQFIRVNFMLCLSPEASPFDQGSTNGTKSTAIQPAC